MITDLHLQLSTSRSPITSKFTHQKSTPRLLSTPCSSSCYTFLKQQHNKPPKLQSYPRPLPLSHTPNTHTNAKWLQFYLLNESQMPSFPLLLYFHTCACFRPSTTSLQQRFPNRLLSTFNFSHLRSLAHCHRNINLTMSLNCSKLLNG